MSVITGFVSGVCEQFTTHMSQISFSESIIFQIALILILCSILAFIAKSLKQSLILSYVIAGLILGPLVTGIITELELIKAFSEIGIAFLLFVAGLEISFKKIKEANLKKISLIGILQIILVMGFTFIFQEFLKLETLQAAYLGIVLSFGSTMVVIKILSDRSELVTMHGRLVLGILLLQDLVAIIAISFFTTGNFQPLEIGISFGKIILMVITAIVLQKFVLNKLFRFAASSTELLLLSSLGVLFLFIALASLMDISLVVGAFIAGVSLANSPFKIELESRISPLRDFFSILFFVALGLQVVFSGVAKHFIVFLFLLVTAIVIKPFITIFLLRVFGYRPKTSFLTGISLAQLSEFSLIIGLIGVTTGTISQEFFSTVILATIITMVLTPYLIEHKDKLYTLSQKPMKLFKFLPIKENLVYSDNKPKEILLVGGHRMGGVILKELMKDKDKLLVLDYNPEVISALIKKKVSSIYGDVLSPELIDNINLYNLKTVISTIPGVEENKRLMKLVKQKNKKTKIILTAGRISEALELYEEGADYVILPKVVAGEELMGAIHHKKDKLKELKVKQIRKLNQVHRVLY
jgi:Kef-type K+ transport system membrane component KefB